MPAREIRQIFKLAIDVVLPPQSPLLGHGPGTGLGVEKGTGSWADIQFLDDPCCYICGFPFEYDMGDGSLCGDCAAAPPAYDRARAAFIYNEQSRQPILRFKHGGRTEGLSVFAAHMRRAGRHFWVEADYIIPVPLHRSRLIKRRFNQAALLSRKIAKSVPASFEPDILFRVRDTPSQGAQTASGRRRNVQGAFHVPDKAKERLKGRRVVLIDDVMTTGATLEACARTLKRAGVSYIDVVTLARTVRSAVNINGVFNG